MSFAELLGRQTDMLLEKFAEKGLRREIEPNGNLLDTHVRIEQHLSGIQEDHLDNPMRGRTSRAHFDNGGEIARRKTLLASIVGHVMTGTEMAIKRNQKVLHDFIGSILHNGLDGMAGEKNIDNLVHQRGTQRLNQLAQNRVVQNVMAYAALHFNPIGQRSHQLLDIEILALGKRNAGLIAEKQLAADVDHLVDQRKCESIIGAHPKAVKIVAHAYNAHMKRGGIEKHLPTFDVIMSGIYLRFGLATLTQENAYQVRIQRYLIEIELIDHLLGDEEKFYRQMQIPLHDRPFFEQI